MKTFRELFEAKAPWQPGYYVTHTYTKEVIDGPHAVKGSALNVRNRYPNGAVHYTDGKHWYPYEGSTDKVKGIK